ncbi:MAG TPA: hypothetical protein VLG49_04885 [Rhabdochlamydiaceae bacterium]|nr:hypothetical protein [Rhabdochlamydiaceae bacterium]
MKKMWVVLVAVSGIAATCFLTQALRELYPYVRLDAQMQAQALEWGILEKGPSKFAISAVYTYQAGNQTYRSDGVLKGPYFLNRLSAEAEIKKLNTQSRQIWYHSKQPGFSRLEKSFPYKSLFNSLVTVGICIYFCGFAKLSKANRNAEL